ncbi:MAG: hypothetical protein AAGC69_20550 [Paracraurococcus sp.]|jgi:hypothetical protein
MSLPRLIPLAAALALAACAGAPTAPASPVAENATGLSLATVNAPYYNGADIDFPRGSTGARSGKGGG